VKTYRRYTYPYKFISIAVQTSSKKIQIWGWSGHSQAQFLNSFYKYLSQCAQIFKCKSFTTSRKITCVPLPKKLQKVNNQWENDMCILLFFMYELEEKQYIYYYAPRRCNLYISCTLAMSTKNLKK